jgi:hypothetical protein
VTGSELTARLNDLFRVLDALETLGGELDDDIPIYGLSSLLLAVAALSDMATRNALTLHAESRGAREAADRDAGLPSPQLLNRIRGLIQPTGGMEVGRWS